MMRIVRETRLLVAFAVLLVGLFVLSATTDRASAQDDRPTLRIAVDTLWPTLEPVLGFSSSLARFGLNIYDPIVLRDFRADPTGNTRVPYLIESAEQISPTVWQLNVREGITFHNGEPMTADDIAFSLSAERLWGPDAIAPRGRSFMRGINRVEATGPMTVEIETDFPDPVLPNRFTFQIGYLVPDDFAGMTPEEFGLAPVGTGPYRVTEFDSGERLVMEAYDDYWGGTPPLAAIEWIIVPEPSARLAGLVSGEFDIIVSIPSDQAPVFDNYDDISLYQVTIDNYPMFAFNTLITEENPDNPLVDANLRKAMVSSVDMDAIVSALWGDVTFHPAPFNFQEYGVFYDPEGEAAYPYDPDRAQELLALTDYDGEELQWHITRGFYPNYEQAAEIMVEMWREAGINVRLDIVDNFRLAYERPFHLLNMSMTSEFSGDPLRPLWIDWGPNSNRANAAHRTWVPTDRFIELGNAFQQEEDLDRRIELYHELLAEWEDITPGFYLWRNVISVAVRDGVNWAPFATNTMMFGPGYITVDQ
ncbi:MAG: ABC transporter substrate-binding protein [Pseudomonadota bacterium]